MNDDEIDERKELEEEQKEIEDEAKEKREMVQDSLKDLIELIKSAKQSGEDYDSFEDWWVDYQSFLWPVCGFPLGREMGEAYWRAFKKLKLGKGELTALAQKLNEVDSSEDTLKRDEAVRVFTAFLVRKGVWAGL